MDVGAGVGLRSARAGEAEIPTDVTIIAITIALNRLVITKVPLLLYRKDASPVCEVSVNMHSTRWHAQGEGRKVA